MSFTSTVKNEITKYEPNEVGNISTLSAIISNAEITDTIKITTENAGFARYTYKLLKEISKIIPKITVRKGYNYNKSLLYILEFKNNKELLNKLGLNNSIIPDEYIVADQETIRYYLKGVFLMVGSINDPKTSRYHLEFVVSDEEYAIFIMNLLNKFYLNSKCLKRENKYMIYVKEAEKISDFLRIVNAINALFYYEDIRIYRDHKNMTNRLNNCEQANVDKIIETALNQLKDIELIEQIGGLDLLDEKTRLAAIYRTKYKEASLTELSEIISLESNSPITKSGLHHRFKKIKELADKIRTKKMLNK